MYDRFIKIDTFPHNIETFPHCFLLAFHIIVIVRVYFARLRIKIVQYSQKILKEK